MKEDVWHYPRENLAARTFNVLIEGPAKALTLFAPRRTGKTEFLTKDFTPYAESKGHKVVYMSFWRAPLSPLALILRSLETTLKSKTVTGRISSVAAMLKPKLKFSTSIIEAKAEAEIDLSSLQGEPPAELILYLDELLARLENRNKPALLLFDEVQELAKDKNNRSLIASLRTSLDIRGAGLKAIFTGSSREGLQAMFSNAEAPLFHFGTALDFEPLDEHFVEHQIKVFERTTKQRLDNEAAQKAFDELHNSPYFFRALIELMTLRVDLTLDEGLALMREQMAEKSGYAALWIKLTDIQRSTVTQLALGADKPFSKSTRTEIGLALGIEPPSIDKVQTALRRLAGLGIVDRWSGNWIIEDPEFSMWVRRQIKDEHSPIAQ